MVTLFMSSNPSEQSIDAIGQELLSILTQESSCYPWDLADAREETYVQQLESQVSFADNLDADFLDSQADRFFASLQQCWAQTAPTTVKAALWQKFARYIPTQRLEAILERAEALVDRNLSPIDQLVECVKPLWSNWADEDLQVFARPVACAMRGDRPTHSGEWDELSEVEQIRLTMTAAQEALQQLSSPTAE